MKKLSIKDAMQVKDKYGTPTYLYSLDKIHQQYNALRKLLSKTCDVFYSMKANPLLAICQYLARQKLGCEVSSQNELLIAIQAGFKPDNIIFVGPGKNTHELTLCVEKKIKAIVCESIEEIFTVNEIAKSYGVVMPILVRFNPDFHVEAAPIKMSGVATQFGMTVAQFSAGYQSIKTCLHVTLCGMQIYNGSRILNEKAIVNNVSHILTCAKQLSTEYKIEWQYIDIGGGFGVPYFENECELKIKKVSENLNKLFHKYNQLFPKTRFILELGRYLVAESGALISSVMMTKSNHGKNFAIMDAGMQCHFSSTGLNSFVQRNFPAIHLSAHNKYKNKMTYHITGPLCTPGDAMLRNITFSEIKTDDFIILLNVGAYGYTASPIRFLSHDAPAEVVILNQKIYLARQRENIQTLLSLQQDLSIILNKE